MITARCNLSCSYCILENAPHQLKQELTLEQKKELIYHLYNKLNFRSLTISGGEALIIGKKVPSEFLDLLSFLKQFKSDRAESNLRIKLYTNGIHLSESVASAMKGIIDEVSINIDSNNKETLIKIGRTINRGDDYISKIEKVMRSLFYYGIKVKLHTVVCALNSETIAQEVNSIYDMAKSANPLFREWKFYQYMSYDDKLIDNMHIIEDKHFNDIQNRIKSNLSNLDIVTHFKNNTEMNNSLFNILATGVAQYKLPHQTWSTTPRTDNLMRYQSMEELFEENNIDVDLFNAFHSYAIQ